MNCIKLIVVLVAILLWLSIDDVEGKKRRKSGGGSKTKTKTKWSTSTELLGGDDGNGGMVPNPVVATEEHGYYVKRTYMAVNATAATLTQAPETKSPENPPFLAVPIAWFNDTLFEIKDTHAQYSLLALNGEFGAVNTAFLCPDDCKEAYAPVCGRSPFEVAVFYNKCKLNVGNCRLHGMWREIPIDDCRSQYPKEVAQAEEKFRASPYFRELEQPLAPEVEEGAIVNIAMEALSEIDQKLAEAEAEAAEHQQQQQNQMTKITTTSENNNNDKISDSDKSKKVQTIAEKMLLAKQQNESEKTALI